MLDILYKNKGEFQNLYRITIEGLPFIDNGAATFIFRPLTVNQYFYYKNLVLGLPWTEHDIIKKEIINNALIDHDIMISRIMKDELHIIEQYGDITVLFGGESKDTVFDIFPAGLLSSLVNAILYVSFPKSTQDFNSRLNKARVVASMDKMSLISSFLAGIFGYKPNEIENMSFDKIAHLVAIAEMTVQIGPKVEIPITFKTEEEIEKEYKKSAKKIDYNQENKELSQEMGVQPPDIKDIYDQERQELASFEEKRREDVRAQHKLYMQKFNR